MRLVRDGWRKLDSVTDEKYPEISIFEKSLFGGWVLRKLVHMKARAKPKKGRGFYWDQHELFNFESGVQISLPDWEWADSDRGSIVWASKGCLYRAVLMNDRELASPVLLHNFNSYTYEDVEAPY